MKIQKPNKVTLVYLKSIVSGIIMIGLIITIVLLGIFIIFPSKNIEGATGATGARGLPNLEFTGNFSLPNRTQASIKKPVFPGQVLENKDKSLENKDRSSIENKDRSSIENKDNPSENKDKSHENKDKSLKTLMKSY